MLETPRAVLDADAIAGASDRLSLLVMGTNDLATELGVEQVPGPHTLLAALGMCLLAARAHGKAIVDGVYNTVTDEAGFEAECLQGRQLGFDAKTLIHPRQVDVCNRVLAPTPEQVADARAVLAAWEEALAHGRGVVTVERADGRDPARGRRPTPHRRP